MRVWTRVLQLASLPSSKEDKSRGEEEKGKCGPSPPYIVRFMTSPLPSSLAVLVAVFPCRPRYRLPLPSSVPSLLTVLGAVLGAVLACRPRCRLRCHPHCRPCCRRKSRVNRGCDSFDWSASESRDCTIVQSRDFTLFPIRRNRDLRLRKSSAGSTEPSTSGSTRHI